jgi:hypothetical protein
MRRLFRSFFLVLAFSHGVLAKEPSGDWQVIKDVPPGWRITVFSGRHTACIFVRATDDELVCGTMQHGWISDPRELHFRRELVREVRIDRGDGLNALAGAGIGGSIGAALGASNGNTDRGAAALLFGVIGASIGLRAGRDCHALRSKLLYRAQSPRKDRKSKERTVTAQAPAGEVIAQTSQ